MDPSLALILILAGLVVGSFLNVCVERLPEDESVLVGRSSCPHCGERIAWYDNLPLLSYVLLGGTGRCCGERISPRYPLGELVSALVFVLGGYRWLTGPLPEWLNFFVFVSFVLLCLTISRIDLRESIIPNELNYSFFLAGVVLAPFTHHPLSLGPSGFWYPAQLPHAAGGLVLGGGSFFAMAVLSPLFYGKPALGMGDVKLMGAMGTWLGAQLVGMTMILGSIIGAVVGTVLMLAQGKSLRTEIPFGPFLCVAGVVSLVAGQRIFNWYLSLL